MVSESSECRLWMRNTDTSSERLRNLNMTVLDACLSSGMVNTHHTPPFHSPRPLSRLSGLSRGESLLLLLPLKKHAHSHRDMCIPITHLLHTENDCLAVSPGLTGTVFMRMLAWRGRRVLTCFSYCTDRDYGDKECGWYVAHVQTSDHVSLWCQLLFLAHKSEVCLFRQMESHVAPKGNRKANLVYMLWPVKPQHLNIVYIKHFNVYDAHKFWQHRWLTRFWMWKCLNV